MKRPYEDEQRLFLVAEMQRPMTHEQFTAWKGVAIGGATFVVLASAVWLLVSLWRCCR